MKTKVLQFDKGFIPFAALATDGKSLAIQIQEGALPQLNRAKIEDACKSLRDALYRFRPDLVKQEG
jgi:hypothetical protein